MRSQLRVPRSERARHRGRPSTWVLAVAATLALLLTPVGPIFSPVQGSPTHVDVIFVLGPPETSRLELAQELMAAGYSENLLISTPEFGWRYRAEGIGLCTVPQEFSVTCLQSEPFTTQGEIGALEQLSQEHGWDSALLITFKPHVTRTHLYLDRCFSGSADVIYDNTPISPREAVYQYGYQTGAFAKAFTRTTGCA